MTREQEVLLYLVRLGIGCDPEPCFGFEGVEWKVVSDMAWRQGVAAIAMDGLQRAYDVGTVPVDPGLDSVKFDWMGRCLSLEKGYGQYVEVLGHLAQFYEGVGTPMMLLKGYGLSLNYPDPSHRPCGDIDIYLFGQWKDADRAMEERLGIAVDNSHHHHSVFLFEGVSVENHFDFVNVHSHLSNKRIEACLKRLAEDRSCSCVLPNGTLAYLPSPDLNALFLARHCAVHFAAERLNLRQLLDWTLFVSKHSGEVDWMLFWSEVEKMGMEKFVLCINAISAELFGVDVGVFHTPVEYVDFAAVERGLVERVLGDILQPEFDEENGKGVVGYVCGRFRRWWHNRWKHRIVYSDGLVSTFFVQVWGHLMKPKSLKG